MDDFTGNSSQLPDPGSADFFGVTDPSRGLPSTDPTGSNPLVSVPDPTPSVHSGFLDSVENVASSALDSVESGASSVFHGAASLGGSVLDTAGSAIKTGYSAGKTVVGDVVTGVEGVASFGVNQIVLVIAVVGIALYFVGKTGAIKVSV